MESRFEFEDGYPRHHREVTLDDLRPVDDLGRISTRPFRPDVEAWLARQGSGVGDE
ncbi:hypothetical protein [Gordonia soli]|uniref:Uncharacterized protein n=1 Tax=Gordonia soli NBRC 108243 TaxID=1223545 RepID=M0QRQ5_9ACTN|nr:hypothetical protein [Gordonia soli]GAC71076.1 hypothetical protein GS4_51_00140 [Gordonia soli NBRC 108243]